MARRRSYRLDTTSPDVRCKIAFVESDMSAYVMERDATFGNESTDKPN
jgi:hypothetical protein